MKILKNIIFNKKNILKFKKTQFTPRFQILLFN